MTARAVVLAISFCLARGMARLAGSGARLAALRIYFGAIGGAPPTVGGTWRWPAGVAFLEAGGVGIDLFAGPQMFLEVLRQR